MFGGGFKFVVQILDDRTIAELVERQAGSRLHLTVFQRTVNRGKQLLQGYRLFQEIQRADFGGFNGGIDAGMTAHHHHGHVELPVFRPFLQQGDAVAVGHPNVKQNHSRTNLMAQLARFFGIFRQSHGITFVLEDFRE